MLFYPFLIKNKKYMACDLSLGRLEPCKDSVGGLLAVYFVNYDAAAYSDATFTADEEIDGFTTFTASAYKYELRGANNFDEANEVSKENGTSIWTGTGTVVLKKQDAATRKELKLMAYGRPIVITEGYDGKFKVYGLQNGCDVSVGTASGAAMADLNGYNLTITAMEKEPAFFMDSSVFGTGLTVVNGL